MSRCPTLSVPLHHHRICFSHACRFVLHSSFRLSPQTRKYLAHILVRVLALFLYLSRELQTEAINSSSNDHRCGVSLRDPRRDECPSCYFCHQRVLIDTLTPPPIVIPIGVFLHTASVNLCRTLVNSRMPKIHSHSHITHRL